MLCFSSSILTRLSFFILILFIQFCLSSCAFQKVGHSSFAQKTAGEPETPLDRDEEVRQYMREFVSGGIRHVFPNIATAIERVLRALPEDVFQLVTDRGHPVIFIDHYTSGIARYAGSDEFVFEPGEPPAFSQGFYLIKVGDAMNDVEDPQAIDGVLLHEIAHRVLNHLRSGVLSCELEREANRLVKRWGFEKEFASAKKHFGSKSKADSPCHP